MNEPPPMRAARRASEKSQHRFQLGAAIAKKNKVLVTGYNSTKTHPRFGSGAYNTLHAESHAISRAIKKGIDLKGTKIYVYRKNSNLAKPCPCCMGLIHKYGIKAVIYSK
jgi:deoxycytidylate deaminase